MSVNVAFEWGNLPTNYCWTDPESYKNAIFNLLTGSIAGGFTGVIVGPNLPSVGDQDKLWQKTDANGRPIGVYLFKGQWLSPNSRPPNAQERMIWKGTELALWSYDGGDGKDPATNPPTDTTGAMWVRDTDFGADDGSIPFRFPVGAGKNPATYDGNPATTLVPGDTGGVERHLLGAAESGLQDHTHSISFATASGTQKSGPSNPVVDTAGVTAGVVGGAVPAALSHTNMPNYYTVLFAKRSARLFYVSS